MRKLILSLALVLTASLSVAAQDRLHTRWPATAAGRSSGSASRR